MNLLICKFQGPKLKSQYFPRENLAEYYEKCIQETVTTPCPLLSK